MKNGMAFSYTTLSVCIILTAPAAYAQPTLRGGGAPMFSKSFNPDSIGPGSVSTLTFMITNGDPIGGVRDLAVTDTLPEGVTMAVPANLNSTCGGTVTAPDGGGTITFSDGSIGASATCAISVDVTSSTPGTHTNVSGDLTSAAGNSGPAQADLIVATDRPGFTKNFSPRSVPFGGRSTLTLTIDNTRNPVAAYWLAFVDQLPPGMVIASPSGASTDCNGFAITAASGGSVVTFGTSGQGIPMIEARDSCTVTVDVRGGAVGVLRNTTGELTSGPLYGPQGQSSGKANATLSVTDHQISLVKKFTNDPVPSGDSVTLEFTVRNTDRSSAATSITFTDDLDAALPGLTALNMHMTDVCGPGSTLEGTSVLTLTGGNLGPGETCVFSSTLQLPANAASGAYNNTTGVITAEVDGRSVEGNAATDALFVSAAPLLEKTYVVDPAAAGDSTVLEFTVTNTSSTSDATDIAFEDVFDAIFPAESGMPAPGFCGAGSVATFTPLDTYSPARLSVYGASLSPGASCTFSVVLDVAVDASTGTYVNTTSDVSATIDEQSVTGAPGTAELFVYGAPRLEKEFIDDPAAPGGTTTLRFTLSHGDGENELGDARNITFTDDLAAVLPGLTAIGLPLNNVCGAGSRLASYGSLTLEGGVLAADDSCTFDVTVQLPGAALPGTYTNTTSNVVATIGGLTTVGASAGDDLDVAGLELTKSFVDDPVIPGDTVTLEFTMANASPILHATGIVFTDNLDQVVPGLAATGLPIQNACGDGSSLMGTSGNAFLIFQGGYLAARSSCTFSATLQVPAGAASGTYTNTTSDPMATIHGTALFLKPATDTLTVSSELLLLTKEFTDDPVVPGGNVNLRFTVTNVDATRSATSIGFTDDLNAALAGLVNVSGALRNVCGAGSQIAGGELLTFTGGALGTGASCSFDVSLAVPSEIPLGTLVTNTTSEGTGLIGGLPVRGDPAHDDLQIEFTTFTKAFDGPAMPGGPSTLTFTIRNLRTETVRDFSFSDDLDSVIPGLVATNLPAVDVCGPGSVLDGTSFLTLRDGNLPPGRECMFNVRLSVPVSAVPGSFLNTTSDLWQAGSPLAGSATDTLVVDPVVDRDNDGVSDDQDNCPYHANADQADCDEDGMGDICAIANGISLDCNASATPDECEAIGGGDFNGDGLVVLSDYQAFYTCANGPETPRSPPAPEECMDAYLRAFDADSDLDVDLRDFSALLLDHGR